MTSIEKAKELSKHFFIAGYGHFDLNIEDVSEIIDILEKSKNISTELTELYDKLYQQRMG